MNFSLKHPLFVNDGSGHYHNPDPLARLMGETNENRIEVKEVECLALIDSRAQLYTIPITFAQKLGVPILKLEKLL